MEEIDLEKEPKTKNKPNKNIWIILLVSLITFIACYFIIDAIINTTSKQKLDITNVSLYVDYNEYLGYSAKITGVAKNTSKKNYSYASVEFSVYDSSGNNLGTALANINNLSSGDSWRFEANLLSFPNTRPTYYKLVDINVW